MHMRFAAFVMSASAATLAVERIRGDWQLRTTIRHLSSPLASVRAYSPGQRCPGFGVLAISRAVVVAQRATHLHRDRSTDWGLTTTATRALLRSLAALGAFVCHLTTTASEPCRSAW